MPDLQSPGSYDCLDTAVRQQQPFQPDPLLLSATALLAQGDPAESVRE